MAAEILSFFEEQFGPEGEIVLNILHYTPKLPIDESWWEKAAECLSDAFSRFRKRGIWEQRMMEKVIPFVNQQIVLSECAVGHQLAISPDGQIGICTDFVRSRRLFRNSVFNNNFDPYQDENFQEWSRRSPLNMSQCLDCEAIAICGGGCPVSAEVRYGSIWEVDQRICPFSKKTLEWLIWDTYSQLQESGVK